MPKIRGVKPDYWSDEAIVELSIPARLLFIGMWNYACDAGHLQDKPKQIKMRIFPGDDVNVTELLRELESSGRIQRADGWISIPKFAKHQKPDRRYWTACEKPGCDEPEKTVSQREARRAHGVQPEGAQGAPDVRTPSAHVDGDGEVMVKGSDSESEPADKPRAKRATQLPTDLKPNEANIQLAISEGVDLRREFPKFCDHHTAKGSTFKDWNRALNTWIRNAAEYGGNVRPLPRPDENAWMRRRPQ